MTATMVTDWASEGRTSDEQRLLDEGLLHLQNGDWQAAVNVLSDLSQRVPGDPRYQRLLQDAQLKSRLRDRPPKRRRRPVSQSRLIWILVVVNLAIWSVVAAGRLYRDQVAPSLAAHGAITMEQNLMAEGKAALESGDIETANTIFQDLLARFPENEFAARALSDIEAKRQLGQRYAEAVTLMGEEQWQAALNIFRDIQQQAPGYEDVEEQVAHIRRVLPLAQTLAEAQAMLEAGQWQQAVTEFRQLQQESPEFRREVVADGLFASYLNQGQAALLADATDVDAEVGAVQEAATWFERALTIRPSDPEANTEYRLAIDYLYGLAAYRQGNWETAITYLSGVYPDAPDYRTGQASARLQTAYVSSGLAFLSHRNYTRAQERFRQAIVIGLEGHGKRVTASLHDRLSQADTLARDGDALAASVAYADIVTGMGFSDVGRSAALDVARSMVSAPPAASVPMPETLPPPAPAVETYDAEMYDVVAGDTLSEIAVKYGTTVQALVDANPIIEYPWLIRTGWQLKIPPPQS